MINNDVLRRIRYIFDYHDSKLIKIFALGQAQVTPAQVSSWLKRDDEEGFEYCQNSSLAAFLNGLIIDKRGPREDGSVPKAETNLNNNMILTKLKIALNLRSDDLMEIMELAEFKVSKHEMSALFRRPDHKHYRACLDQFLRNFLLGLSHKFRPQKG